MMVDKQHVSGVFVIMGAGFVDTLGQRWRATAKHSKHVHLQKAQEQSLLSHDEKLITRKLSYRKDDRAMRPTYGCPENFRESLSTPTATVPKIFNRQLFRSIL